MVDPLLKVDAAKENIIDEIQSLKERMDELERFALTSQNILASKIGVGNVALGDIEAGDIATVPLQDYTASSIRVGWASFVTAQIRYKKIGKLVFVDFELRGTSDDTTATMTLPYSQEGITTINKLIRIKNDGTWGTGFYSFPNGSSTVTFYSNTGGAAWHVSAADKWVIGQIRYETE